MRVNSSLPCPVAHRSAGSATVPANRQDEKRIASPANVPETSSVASPSVLPLPHGPPAEPQLLFCFINQGLLMLALWSCGRRASVVQAQRQIHRVVLAACTSLYRIRGSSPSIDCGFDARRTSHPVAVLRAAGTTIPHSGGHRAREGGSTLYGGISQPLFATVRPPGSNAADQASWNSR